MREKKSSIIETAVDGKALGEAAVGATDAGAFPHETTAGPHGGGGVEGEGAQWQCGEGVCMGRKEKRGEGNGIWKRRSVNGGERRKGGKSEIKNKRTNAGFCANNDVY